MIYYIIPARKGSKGLPGKNKKLLPYTLDSIKDIPKEQVIITTNDKDILIQSRARGYTPIYRTGPKIHKDKSNIKDVLQDVIDHCNIDKNDIIVLLYLTYPERSLRDIKRVLNFFKEKGARSLLCKKEIEGTHPYLYFFEKANMLGEQLVIHDEYRRQDYPKVFECSHYIFICKVAELPRLKKNLYNGLTIFYPIDIKTLDVDYIEDFEKIKLPKIEIHGSYKNPIAPLDPNVLIKDSDSELLLDFKFVEFSYLKQLIRGKRVVCIANSGLIRDNYLGSYIDEFDVVIRFNSFNIDKESTGVKTTIHATTYLQDYNLDVECDLRIVCCGKKYPYWRHFIREKIKKGKQKAILRHRWFYSHKIFKELKDESTKRMVPTTGFSIIRLIHWLNNYKSFHLLGFDFFKNKDIFRQTPGISTIHTYNYESDWVEKHFEKKDELESWARK